MPRLSHLIVRLLLLLAACAHGHWDPTARRVCSRNVCYRMGELPGWQLLRQKDGEIAFYQTQFDAVAQANATCRDDADATPLEVLMRHLLIGYTEVQVQKKERLPLDGREALHQLVAARLDGVPVVLDLYVIKRNGCIFDLSLAAMPARYADVERDFARFVAGFAQEERS
jgi:hypothetical protein